MCRIARQPGLLAVAIASPRLPNLMSTGWRPPPNTNVRIRGHPPPPPPPRPPTPIAANVASRRVASFERPIAALTLANTNFRGDAVRSATPTPPPARYQMRFLGPQPDASIIYLPPTACLYLYDGTVLDLYSYTRYCLAPWPHVRLEMGDPPLRLRLSNPYQLATLATCRNTRVTVGATIRTITPM